MTKNGEANGGETVRFDELDGVKLLRWHYKRDLQDIEANIEIVEDGGFFGWLFSLSFGNAPKKQLEYLNKIKKQKEEFLRITD